MKNFSTVATRLVAVALLGYAAGPAMAATCTFRADAPDQHTVVKRDTLWDISGTFLNNPWCWPEVWGLNRDEIRNPHWIYPGQIIYFDRVRGRLSLTRPGNGTEVQEADQPPVTRLSPQLRTEDLGKDAVPAIGAGVIEPFLTQPLVVEASELAAAPRIAASPDGHLYLGVGDKIYVRGELKGGSSFQVFRPGKPLSDPETGRVIAHETSYLGTAKLQAEATPGVDVHTFTVSNSKQEMAVGDLLMPAPPTPIRNYMPHSPEKQVTARVMSTQSGVTYAGQSEVVTVNRGSLDGLDVGSVLQLYHYGKSVPDPTRKRFLGLGRKQLKLPDEQFGSLFIFRVFGHVSYGLIMQVAEPAQVGDVARSPE